MFKRRLLAASLMLIAFVPLAEAKKPKKVHYSKPAKHTKHLKMKKVKKTKISKIKQH